MVNQENVKGLVMVLLASLILGLTVSFRNNVLILYAFVSFAIIISANILVKKWMGYMLETEVKTKFWTMSQYAFRRDAHTKNPVPMAWLPLLLALFTKGFFWWLPILEFDIKAKPERASKRHGLYRFTQVTEWHIALIAMWGIIANLTLAVIAYIIGFEPFAKFSIYYAVWSIVPIGRLDGSKIYFANRALWYSLGIVLAIFAIFGLTIPL